MKRRQRGSIFIYVLVMVSAITAVIIATANVSVTVLQNQERRERRAVARAAFLGAVAKLTEDVQAGTITTESTPSVSVGGYTWTITVANGTLSKTYKITGETTTRNGKFRFERVIGNRQAPKPYYYAIFSNSSLNTPYNVTTGASSANGDVYVNGDFTVNGATSFANGDVEITGNELSNGSNLKISGMKNKRSPLIPFPTDLSNTAYQNAALANGSISLSLPIVGNIFINLSTTEYPVMYVDGNLTLSGVFGGKGTIYCTGSVDIVGNMSYLDSSSRLAVVCANEIRIRDVATSVVGYLYAAGRMRVDGTSSQTHTVTKGSLCGNTFDVSPPLVVVNDPTIFTTPAEGVKMRLPGLWP